MTLDRKYLAAVVLLMLVFIGQGMASIVMPYEMANVDHAAMMAMASVDDAELDKDSDGLDMGCCLEDNDCALGSCGAPAMLTTLISAASFIAFDQDPGYNMDQTPNLVLPPAFRPPITR